MGPTLARQLAASARVATLATIGADGLPHLVPCVFALVDDVVYTPVDTKPKRTRRLRRLDNIERDPRAVLLVQRWEEDWTRLWWVRLEGRARTVSAGDELATARRELLDKYPQYNDGTQLHPVLAVHINAWRVWSAREH